MDQECVRVDLGVHDPGTILFFEISAGMEVDILLFPSNTISIYLSEQSYRSDNVWVAESVFESFSGSGEWHWEVPSDRDSTRWYLVIDNMAHVQDSGEGDQGGLPSEVDLEAGVIQPEQFTLSDSIHRVDPGDYSIVHGPFSIDEGTYLEIHARTMEGSPDIFVMTETAYSYYSPSTNWSSSLRTLSADMLLVSNERYLPWEVIDTDGEDLYIVVDNRPGPGGGGAGNSRASVTVTVTLTPILDPTISSEIDLETVDVGSIVTLSALETPNKSNQIMESGYSWEIDGVELSGPTIEYIWDKPGNFTVDLTVTSVDSRSANKSRVIRVLDMSDPSVSLATSGEITKGFGEELVLSGTFTDNWGVKSLDWLIDGEVIWSNYSLTQPSSTLILEVTNDFSPGSHIVSLSVLDYSGRNSRQDVRVNFIDVTPPEISQYDSQMEVVPGDPVILQIFAQDNESDQLDYSWTIFQGTENEMNFYGPQVIYQFSEPGPQSVICRVENDAGLTSFADILVIVEEPESEERSSLLTIAIISLVLFSSLAAVGIYGFNTFVVRRMDEISEPEKTEEEEHLPEPSTQSQMQMWGERQPYSFQAPMGHVSENLPEPDVMDILGVEPPVEEMMEKNPHSSLLADLEEIPEQTSEKSEVTSVRKNCQKCSRPFEISLPQDVLEAYTNCPYCGSEELVSMREHS